MASDVNDVAVPPGSTLRRPGANREAGRAVDVVVRGIGFQKVKGSLPALMSSRLGCDAVVGVIDLTSLCAPDT
jgi:hypothetical protein